MKMLDRFCDDLVYEAGNVETALARLTRDERDALLLDVAGRRGFRIGRWLVLVLPWRRR